MSEVRKYKAIGDMTPRSRVGGGEWVRLEDYDAALSQLAALREELTEANEELYTNIHNNIDLTLRLADAERRNGAMSDALLKIIEMNRQHAEDQYGDPDKAESWACITVARAALTKPEEAKS